MHCVPRVLILILLIGAPLQWLHAADGDALARLDKRLGPLRAMQAQFVQTVYDERGEPLQSSEGSMVVQRSNRLRWETTSPFNYLIVTDGVTLWRYDADLEQATRTPFSGELANAPALILSGDTAKIGAQYAVSWEQLSDGELFTLVPHNSDSLFRELQLKFSGSAVSELRLRDNLDQRTEIRFFSLVVNPTLTVKTFQFVAPEGVDVISEAP
jgi:outer membrane lipoprotein carrier protein